MVSGGWGGGGLEECSGLWQRGRSGNNWDEVF